MGELRYKWIVARLKNEELIYSILCSGVVFSLVFLPLLNSILSIALFFYWLLFSKKQFSIKSRKSKLVILFCLPFLVALAGVFYSDDIGYALSRVQKKSALMLFPLVLGTATITSLVYKRTFVVFYWSVFIGCVFCIANGVYGYLVNGSTAQLYGYDMVVLKRMTQPIMGLYCVLAFLYLLNDLYARISIRRIGRTFYLNASIAAGLLGFLLLLGNRNAIFCAGVISVFYLFKILTKWLYRVFLVSVLTAVFVLAIIFNPALNRQWKDLIDFSQENSIQLDQDRSLGRSWGGKALRLSIWECSLDVIKKNWLIGVGTGDVQNSLQKAYEERKFYFASRYNRYDAHNQYIQETVSSGAIGLMIFLSCIFVPLFISIKRRTNLIYIFFILCFAISCITQSLLELNKGIVWYSFFNSFILFANSSNHILSFNGNTTQKII